MEISDYLAKPDEHLNASVAAHYDESVAAKFAEREVGPAVRVLSELAGPHGTAVEFAVGTGRLALPLAASGVHVFGIDFSEPMLNELRAKEGAHTVHLTLGDMTQTVVCDDAAVVYLVFNTIGNLRTQQQQVQCFRNAAAHLRPGGCFVIETIVPNLSALAIGQTICPSHVSERHLGFDEIIDGVNQLQVSHHYFFDGDKVEKLSGAFRYVWPSELDLMAQLAGMVLESRWADWNKTPFTAGSRAHVSVWRKPIS